MTVRPVFLCAVTTALSLPAYAEGTRELDAHEHGHGALNIAIEGDSMALELEVPGFDIVGFEYEAESDEDKAAVDAALALLRDTGNVFVLPEAAGCSVTEAMVDRRGEEDAHHDGHDDHDSDEDPEEHAHDDHEGDEDHDEHAHEDHEGDEDHDEHAHDDHEGDKDHDEHAHDDHEGEEDHDEHAHDAHDTETHSEFHAHYVLTCSDIAQATSLELSYFKTFENAEELEVQLVTETGAARLEASAEDPVLDLTQAM